MYDNIVKNCSEIFETPAKVISIGYYTKFLVPGHLVPQVVEMFGRMQLVEGSGSTETLKPIEFEIKTPHEDLGRKITAREAELAKLSEENSTKWYKEYNKNQELEKKLAAANAKIEALAERGTCGLLKDPSDEVPF